MSVKDNQVFMLMQVLPYLNNHKLLIPLNIIISL